MFESDFLTTSEESQSHYCDVISETAKLVAAFLPDKPYNGSNPRTLSAMIEDDFLPEPAASSEQLETLLQTVVANSVFVGHPNTAAHLHCPPLVPALAAEVVISALNQSMDSFDEAPVATIVEQKLIRWLCTEAGLPASADGTFTTGGSQSNYMALLLARDAYLQKHWNWSAQILGLPPDARRFRILCSDVAHFTVEKSASQLGLGSDAVIRIPVDDHFRMQPAALRAALLSLATKDLLPMAVVATAGTTDFGSLDPLPEIAEIVRQADTWLHVDAAYGGALLFSAAYRSKLQGLDAADSLTIDFHKLFWQPIPCSAFLLRERRHFDLIKVYADYLNPEIHEQEGVPNLVTTSLLTSRRFDALKLWISFQSLGRTKLSAMIDRTIELAALAGKIIRESRELELMAEPQLSTVVFRYRPLRAPANVDLLNSRLRQRLFDRGIAVVGHTRVRKAQCLKLTCMNPTESDAQMEALIRAILDEGEELEVNAGS